MGARCSLWKVAIFYSRIWCYGRRGARRLRYLHPEEGDAGQEIDGRLQVLESLGVSCWEIILRRESRRVRSRT